MSDGYFIRFREMIPEEGLLKLAMAEISMLHDTWPERVQCNIVIASRHPCAHERRYDAEVQVELGRGDNIEAGLSSAETAHAHALLSASSAMGPAAPQICALHVGGGMNLAQSVHRPAQMGSYLCTPRGICAGPRCAQRCDKKARKHILRWNSRPFRGV
jgi:hypothetical protein